ncbi:MAG: DUF1552 domain-containing protein [Deltaproteobacteria bacterium]|nr:DUF1552 domain-containing protein [Deltaproteobacteria bacterium]
MKLSRRTMLRGFLGGAAVGIGLPPLEVFFDRHGLAYADGGLPKRFGIWFWGNGNLPQRWNPIGEGAEWTLSEQLQPLASVKSEITVVSGMSVKTGNTIPHGSGPAGILSGAPLIVRSGDDFSFSAPSIDQVIAAQIGGETRFRSLELGVRPDSGLSYNGPNSKNPPESSPWALFNRIFGGGFTAPGEEPVIDPKIRLRRSVLDVVMADAGRLRGKLGRTDQLRLEQHLDGVRELERRLARLEEDPPSLAACAVPGVPAEAYPDNDGRPRFTEINQVMAELMAMAMACDQTRVFSYFFTYPVNNLLFPGVSTGHHRMTHDEPGDQPQVNQIVVQIITAFGQFLEKLRAVPEGAGTLLDNCAILGTTDVSFGRNHSLDDYPIIIAGTAGGALKKGLHYRSPSGENTSMVLVSLLRAMGLVIDGFGEGAGRSEQGLGAIEA